MDREDKLWLLSVPQDIRNEIELMYRMGYSVQSILQHMRNKYPNNEQIGSYVEGVCMFYGC